MCVLEVRETVVQICVYIKETGSERQLLFFHIYSRLCLLNMMKNIRPLLPLKE